MRRRIGAIGACVLLLSGSALPQESAELPMPAANNGVAQLEVEGERYLYSYSGLGAGKTRTDITSAAFAVNLDTGDVTELDPVPGDKHRLASIAVGLYDRVFIFGGYTVAEDGGEVSTPEVYAFNPFDGSYQRRADMPTPVDDTVAFAHANRYIYLISGWHNDRNVSNVQVFDTWEDRWFPGTEYPGTPVFGHAGGVVGDTVVIADGVGIVPADGGRRRFAMVDDAYKGTIDGTDPARITWERLPPHPGAPLYRMAAVGSESNNLVVFAGGSDNPYNYTGIGYDRQPSAPSARVFAYDVAADQWVDFADKPVASMDHRGLLVFDGVFYTVGGMLAEQTVTARILPFALESSAR